MNKEIYTKVIFEDNRYIEPPSQLLLLSDKIFNMIESRLHFLKKDQSMYFDYLTLKLGNLYSAFKSGNNLVYPRDRKNYLKIYAPTENMHLWEYTVAANVSDALEKAMYIKQIKGDNIRGYRTIAIIRPFLDREFNLLRPYRIKLSDSLNPIELRKREKYIGADGRIKYRKIPVAYKDNQDERIPKMRRELNRIFNFYKGQDLAGLIPYALLSEHHQYTELLNQYSNTGKIDLLHRKDGQYFNIKDRWVKRIFNNSTFINGGRLYAFWQTLPKGMRKYLLINGQNVAELDYSGCQIRMLYHMWLNKPCIDKDVYQIYGLSRDIAKKAAVICINAETHREAIGALHNYCFSELKMTHLTYQDIMRMIKEFEKKHRAISDCFLSGAGVSLMRIESEIIVRIIRALMNLNISVLTVHDSCIYPVKYQRTVFEAMMDEYYSVLKFYPTIKIEN